MTRTEDVTAELIPLTGVSPRAALAAARSLLAGKPGPREASVAHQAAAIVRRAFGDVHAAIREFRLAARLARAAADPGREADVLTSLGTALVMAGRTRAGLAALDGALALAGQGAAGGAALGRILVRRGGSLHIAGPYEQARADLRKPVTPTRRAAQGRPRHRDQEGRAHADRRTDRAVRRPSRYCGRTGRAFTLHVHPSAPRWVARPRHLRAAARAFPGRPAAGQAAARGQAHRGAAGRPALGRGAGRL